jgi:hypothetical protein
VPVQVALSELAGTYAVCRLPVDAALPGWVLGVSGFVSVTRTAGELSVTCRADAVPPGTLAEGEFAALEVEGPLPISMIGVLAAIAGPLAGAGVSVFAISTYDTDYVLVKRAQLDDACQALELAGHRVSRGEAERPQKLTGRQGGVASGPPRATRTV